MFSNCAKCGQKVEAETLGECAHVYCTPCQKLILAALGFNYETEQRRYNRVDIRKEAAAAMRCPICYKSKICQNCQNIFISKDTNLKFCKDCVTSPTKEAVAALKIGYGLQKSHEKHLFPRCKSCDQVYDFNRRNPLKLSCSCTICADCYGQNGDNCCTFCKKQWDEEATVETSQVIVDEIARILSVIKKNEEDCVLICTECAKEDVETDMNVCKECAMEKYGCDVESEEAIENIDTLAICSTCALKKHLPKSHKILDFYPLRSKAAMKVTRKIVATKLGEIENKVTGFDSTWDRMSHLVSKTKVELEKMMAIMENSKNTHDRNLVMVLYEKNAKKVVEFLDAVNGGFGDMLEKLNVTFNELFAQNVHFSLKNDILNNNSVMEMSNVSLPLNYEEDQRIVICEKTAEKPKEDVPVIVRREPMCLSAPPAAKKMKIPELPNVFVTKSIVNPEVVYFYSKDKNNRQFFNLMPEDTICVMARCQGTFKIFIENLKTSNIRPLIDEISTILAFGLYFPLDDVQLTVFKMADYRKYNGIVCLRVAGMIQTVSMSKGNREIWQKLVANEKNGRVDHVYANLQNELHIDFTAQKPKVQVFRPNLYSDNALKFKWTDQKKF